MRVSSGCEAAGQMHDRLLGMARTGPPPRNRKRRRCQPTASRINPETLTQPNHQHTNGATSAQRATRYAVRRVAEIERSAELLEAVGLRDASMRLGAIARSIRVEVLS